MTTITLQNSIKRTDSSSSIFKHRVKSKFKKISTKHKPHFQTASTAYTIFTAIRVFGDASSWFNSLPFASEIQYGISLVPSFIEVIAIPSHIRELRRQLKRTGLKGAEKAERNLVIVSKVVRLGCAVLSCIKISEAGGAVLFGSISKSLGRTSPVLKGAVSGAASFTIVFTALQILKALIDIGIDTVHIYQENKKIKHLNKKADRWNCLNWNDDHTSQFAKSKIDQLQVKQKSAAKERESLNKNVQDSADFLNKQSQAVQKKRQKLIQRKQDLKGRCIVIRLVGKIPASLQLKKAMEKEKIAQESHEKFVEDFKNFDEKYNRRIIKIRNWKIIDKKITSNKITEADKTALNVYKNYQLNKIQVQKGNHRQKKFKIAASILLEVIVINSLVASLVFSFTAGQTPGAVVTTAVLMILIALGEYGVKTLKRKIKPSTWTPVPYSGWQKLDRK